MSALVAVEVSIRGAVNAHPLSIAERTQTLNKSPNQTNVTGATLPCIFIVLGVTKFSLAQTVSRDRKVL